VGREGKGSIQPRTPPLAHILLNALANESPRFAAIVVLVTSNGCPRVVTSNLFSHQHTDSPLHLRRENVHVKTGPKQQIAELDGLLLRNRLGGYCDGHRGWSCVYGGPDQGNRLLRRKRFVFLWIEVVLCSPLLNLNWL